MNPRPNSSIGQNLALTCFLFFACAVAVAAPRPITLLAGSPSSNRVYRVTWDGQKATVTPGAQLPFPAGITTRPALPGGRPARQFVVSNGNPSFGKSAVAMLSGSSPVGFIGNLGDAYGIAADSVGNLWVAESAQHRVRRITEAGVVEDFVGGLGNPYAVAVDALDRVLVTETSAGRLFRITAAGEVETLATGLGAPNGVAVSPNGSVFVADSAGAKVWEVKPEGTKAVFKTVAPYPTGLAFDADGWLYVSDYVTGDIRALSPLGDIQVIAKVPGGALFLAAVPPADLPLGPLRIRRDSDRLVLSWDGALSLQKSTNPESGYEVVPGAASPWTVETVDAVSCFRLVRQP